jgi:TrpR-related protein YerC/YecD
MARASSRTEPAQGQPSHEIEDLPGLDDLADAFLSLETPDEAKRFLRDLCTVAELEALVHRWQIARLLQGDYSYLDIADRVHASTATVTRVAHWLRHGTGGYAVALERTRPAE